MRLKPLWVRLTESAIEDALGRQHRRPY